MYGGTFNYPQRVTQLKFHTYEQKNGNIRVLQAHNDFPWIFLSTNDTIIG